MDGRPATLLKAELVGIPVVSPLWLDKSLESGSLLPESDYLPPQYHEKLLSSKQARQKREETMMKKRKHSQVGQTQLDASFLQPKRIKPCNEPSPILSAVSHQPYSSEQLLEELEFKKDLERS